MLEKKSGVKQKVCVVKQENTAELKLLQRSLRQHEASLVYLYSTKINNNNNKEFQGALHKT